MATSLWEIVRERLNPILRKPRLRPEIVISELDSARHGTYYIVKSPQAGTYLRLSQRERDLLELMDGARTVKEIVVEDFYAHGSMAFNRVLQLVELLHRQSFLVDRPIATYMLIRERLRAPHGLRAGLSQLRNLLLRNEIALPNIDAFVTAVYRSGGWVLVTRPAVALLSIVAVIGFVVFQFADRTSQITLADVFTSGAGLLTALVVLVFFAAQIFCHEMAHALVCKSFGRQVWRGGFELYLGFPAFFVDTTDVWLENRWRRIVVSAAGSASDLVVAGTCSLLALVLPPHLAAISLLLAGFAYVLVAWNLVPLLEVDGYYVLVDLLEMPMLRPRAFSFIRERLLTKLWHRERFSGEELVLTLYGVVAGLFTAVFFIKSVGFLGTQVSELVASIASTGNWALVPAVLLIVVVIGLPMLLRGLGLGSHAVQAVGRGVRVLADVVQHVHLHSRTTLLAGIPMLAELPLAQLEAIAARMRERHYRAGSTIVRQGETGDRFFLITRGTVEVVRAAGSADRVSPTGAASERVATLEAGDYFGELALLNRAPRAATVRALTSLDVLELAADDFARLVSPTWQLEERMVRAVAQRDELANMGPFKELRPFERDLLLTKVREESFEAGEVIIQQGEAGDNFYILREGRVEVSRKEPGGDSHTVAELGPGDYFGELALLLSKPRTATVRALSAVRVWSLGARDFDDLLLHYLRLSSPIESTRQIRMEALEHARAGAA
jgi:CRP-like cAMP-binding protein/Zn-dependent protease